MTELVSAIGSVSAFSRISGHCFRSRESNQKNPITFALTILNTTLTPLKRREASPSCANLMFQKAGEHFGIFRCQGQIGKLSQIFMPAIAAPIPRAKYPQKD